MAALACAVRAVTSFLRDAAFGRPRGGLDQLAHVLLPAAVERAHGALVRGGWRAGGAVEPVATDRQRAGRLQAAVGDEVLKQTMGLLRGVPVACDGAGAVAAGSDGVFELERRPCGDGRGDGVFVRSARGGFVRPGQVVALFPGLVHHGIPDAAGPDDPVPVWEGVRSPFAANDKRINLPAGGFVDGLEWERWAAGGPHSGLGASAGAGGHAGGDVDGAVGAVGVGETPRSGVKGDHYGATADDDDDDDEPPGAALAGLSNEFALGHLVNHPGTSQRPNVMDWAVRLDLDELEAARVPRHRVPYAVHPVWYYARAHDFHVPVPPNAFVPAVVMLATRPILEGEEILFDYNLRPGSAQRLDWYVARDAASDAAFEAESGSRPPRYSARP